MAKAEWKRNTTKTQQETLEMKIEQHVPSKAPRPSQSFDSDSETKDVRTIKKNKIDPLSAALNERGYVMNAHFVWLATEVHGHRYAMSIDRYYQNHKLAVDLTTQNTDLVESKRKLCKENGVHYFYCTNNDDVVAMINELPNLKEMDIAGTH